jgi:hypothetical protein
MKQNSMALAKIDALKNHDTSPVESKFGEDWIPELTKLKKTLTAERRARFKGLSSESTPAMMGADGTALQKCWDCDENGHRRGDPSCRQQGARAGSTCPEFLRKLKAAGKDVTPKVGGSGGGNNRGTKRKSGGGNECHFYKHTGTCKFSKDCKFDHVDGGRSGASMMSKKTQKKMKKKIKDAVMQALEAEAKSAGASGDDAKEDGKKKLAQMIATAA